MTMASSTMKPDAMLRAISERLSRLKPMAAITPNVAINVTGRVTLGITVAQNFRRNRNITRMTSPTVSASVHCTSATEARIVVVRSAAMSNFKARGANFCNEGSRALTASTTRMMLDPGWRFTLRIRAGLPLYQAAI